MDNFEARYRAIVEKRPELRHPHLVLGGDDTWHNARSDGDWVGSHVARDAVCWWLAGKLPKPHCIEISDKPAKYFDYSQSGYDCEVFAGDPADAILTAWEIVLGIKEKA